MLPLILLLFNWFDWKSLKTENFTVIYKPGYEWEATQTLNNLEYYRERVISLTGNDPNRVWVVIEDLGMLVNGFADPITRDIHIFTYPEGSTESWYRTVSVHEYTHICHLTKTKGMPSLLTSLLGTPFQPNLYSPGWIIEGITVYSESQISPYEGRLNDGGFDSYIAAISSRREFPSIHHITYSPLEFPYGGIYLYGGEFFNYLASRYGEDKFSHFFTIYGSYFWAPLGILFPFIGIDRAAKQVYNKSFPSLYLEWKRYAEKRYRGWRVEGERLTEKGWYLRYPKRYKDKLYYVREYPEKTDALKTFYFIEIIERDLKTDREKVILFLTSPVSGPLRIQNNRLYYTTLEWRKGCANIVQRGFGYTSKLHLLDLKTHRDRVLFSDDIRGFSPLPDGRILYSKDRRDRFGSELWIYSKGKRERLYKTPYLIGEIEADSNHIVVTARRDFENWNIYLLNLDKQTLLPLVESPWLEKGISLSKDTLLFTANYDRIYSIYEYNLSQGELYQLTRGGYASFGQLYQDTLYFTGLTKQGFDLYKRALNPKKFKLKRWEKISPPIFPKLKVSRGGYWDVFKTLFKPALHIPIAFPSDTTLKSWYLGGLFAGSDVTYENLYALFLAYNPLKRDLFLSSFLASLSFSPLEIGFLYNSKGSGELILDYPLWKGMGPGLSEVFLILDNRVWGENLSRKEIAPGLSLTLRYPMSLGSILIGFPIESELFGSKEKRSAQTFKMRVRRYAKGGELRISLWGHNDPELREIEIRGYHEIYTERGIGLVVEYGHPLLRIRKGFWNPNIFFEDLCGTLFTDMALPIKGRFYISSGMELKLETGLGLGFLKLVPKVGLVINREREINLYGGFEL